MVKFAQTWGELVVKYRVYVLLVTAVLIGVAPLSFNRLYYDASNEAYFVEGDPNLANFDKLLDLFGDSEYLVVGIPAREQDQDVFNPETITVIDELTQFLEEHEHVTQVRSISKYQYTHNDNGLLATDDLFEDIDTLSSEPEALNSARGIMAEEQLALDTLITRDFQHTRIAARVEYIKNENDHNVKLVKDLLNFIDQQAYRERGFELRLSGVPVIGERFETLTKEDQAILNPAMAIVIMLVLLAVFKSVFAMFAPVVVILSTLLLLTSVQAIFRFPSTAVSSALIPTMIILSIGACVHVLVEFYQMRRRGLAPKEAAAKGVADLFFAILFTSLTTAFGFIALAVTDLKPVREFAILGAIGPMIIFVIATTTLPAVLSFVRWMPWTKAHPEDQKINNWLASSLPQFTYQYRKRIAFTGALITLFSLYSIQHIRVDTNILNYFKDSAWVNKDIRYFDEHFSGVANLEIIIDTDEMGGVKNPDVLQRADALQAFVESVAETGNANSVMDFYKQINQSLHEDNKAYFELPSTRPMSAQFLLLYENTGPNEDLSDLKDFNEQILRISVPIENLDASEQTRVLNEIKAGIANNFSDLNLELTGSMVMNNAQNEYTNQGMFQSFGIAIFVIGLSFLVLFGSLKHGVIALLPSVVPVILTGGLVSYAGVALDLGTMIVGAMTIGIAVDDSIHIMSRYRLMRARGHDVNSAISKAMSSSGRAVILTSTILVIGFSVMLFGNFIPFIYVGLFSAMIMIFALIGDLIFMPALLHIFDGRQAKDNEQIQIKGETNHIEYKGEPENA